MSIQIEFIGAVDTVTGSKTLIRFQNRQYLLDCGLFQGHKKDRERNWNPPEFKIEDIDAVILTHAHLDHSGYVPRLAKLGFKKPVYCSEGTAALCDILWRDSARLAEEDAEYANRTGHSRHKPALPLYDLNDAEAAINLLKAQKRNQFVQIGPNIAVKFLRSGHIVGSCFIQIRFQEGENSKVITFSGDIGSGRLRTLKGPVDVDEADILVVESTYGDREQSRVDPKDELGVILKKVIARGGVAVIPAFSVGRSQEVLYLIRILENEGVIPLVPVILDSPMSLAATDVFLKFEDDSNALGAFGNNAVNFFPHKFERIESVEDSMMACMLAGPMIVLSAAGMLTGGRVLHHLKKRLPDEKNAVVFVGYQAEGSKGRYLQDFAAKEGNMRIFHETVEVNAEIATVSSLSAHADLKDLLEWIQRFRRGPRKIYVNHGTEHSSKALALMLSQKLGIPAVSVIDEKKFQF